MIPFSSSDCSKCTPFYVILVKIFGNILFSRPLWKKHPLFAIFGRIPYPNRVTRVTRSLFKNRPLYSILLSHMRTHLESKWPPRNHGPYMQIHTAHASTVSTEAGRGACRLVSCLLRSVLVHLCQGVMMSFDFRTKTFVLNAHVTISTFNKSTHYMCIDTCAPSCDCQSVFVFTLESWYMMVAQG
jgi:hypothetical protein